MSLSKEQEQLYRKAMEEAKKQLDTIDDEMEREIQKARETLAKLQGSKKSFSQLYEGAAHLLGLEVEKEGSSENLKGNPSSEAQDIDKELEAPEKAENPPEEAPNTDNSNN